ncbi:GNAT family N-acetyltransferase [Pseudoruegeria sp. HB172150]|uniref:GNAT family N-acetyltransferase n=1 Tax=Pseudoruegeria sp. HB172150 TaxID=2721164 RepID=UPI0015581E52|nr:GNAT family N-acetyltransferase [Pseudoruegeria sp. HB172150]
MVFHTSNTQLPQGITIRLACRRDIGPALVKLLDDCFSATFDGRTFYKQQPHHRLLAFENDRLVGHVGLDFRVITVGGTLYEIVGIIDLCVAADRRGLKIGTALVRASETFDVGRDFSLLFADDHRVYEANGYQRIVPAHTRWLAIDELRSHSVIERDLHDCFMAKSLGTTPWPRGEIDLLGYLF